MTLRPYITEKSIANTKIGKFTFILSGRSTKISIARELKKQFNVNPTGVSIVNIRAKNKRIGATRKFRLTGKKIKAIVTLKAGEVIPGFES